MKIKIAALSFLLIASSCMKESLSLPENGENDIRQSTALTSLLVFANGTNRTEDPVVITGQNLSISPSSLVAFRYDTDWVQIPLQVDERNLIRIEKPYKGTLTADEDYKILVYTDSKLPTGTDSNPLIDADDEIVFMLKDAGSSSGVGYPSSVDSSAKKEVLIQDGTSIYYVYLFKQTGSLQQGAGVNYVKYTYQPTSTTFNYNNKRNTENSWIETSTYKWHYAAEWISDALVLNNVDILDRYKNFFGDASCLRSEDTFSDGENAFVTNITGPVRAIRSYMGANSGPYTQRTHVFYQSKQEITTNLRVHEVKGINDVFDYSLAAKGMKYSNSNYPAQVTIDGIMNDGLPNFAPTKQTWELVTGNIGSLVILNKLSTNATPSEARYYGYWDDGGNAARSKCTGDGQAIGTSGVQTEFLNTKIFTDPIKSSYSFTSPYFRLFEITRILYFPASNVTNVVAQEYSDRVPITVQVQ